jgi:hypothetical protein
MNSRTDVSEMSAFYLAVIGIKGDTGRIAGELLSRLKDRKPPLVGEEEMDITMSGDVVDKTSGGRGALVGIQSMNMLADGVAEVMVWCNESNHSGGAWGLRVVRNGDSWRVGEVLWQNSVPAGRWGNRP